MLFFSTFVGNVIDGTTGGWWDTMSHVDFFLLHAAFAAAALIAMLLIARPATRLLCAREANV